MSEATTHTEPSESKVNRAAVSMLIGTPVTMMIGPFMYWALARHIDTFLAMVLLMAPSVLSMFGARRLLTIQQEPEVLTQRIATFDVVKNLLVTAFLCCEFIPLQISRPLRHTFSYVSLIAACVLVGLIYKLTSWIMNAPTENNGKTTLQKEQLGVIDQLLQHRFLSICGLLVASLHLTIFLALAVAFHDRATDGKSFARQVYRDDLTGAPPASMPARQAAVGTIRTFVFALGSTSLRCAEELNGHPFTKEFYADGTENEWRLKHLKDAKLSKECVGELREAVWNAAEMAKLKADVTAIYSQSAFDRYRVALVSHANDAKPNPGFASNYEMSRARAEQVQALIETIFAKLRNEDPRRPPLNVEWQIMPSGTGNMYLSLADSTTVQSLEVADLKRELTTEVQFTRIPDHLTKLQREVIERQNSHAAAPELHLLDYLYFMITNASGSDLAPASGFVQFVSSAGHIFQLFLLAVAFNVILAVRRPLIGKTESAQA